MSPSLHLFIYLFIFHMVVIKIIIYYALKWTDYPKEMHYKDKPQLCDVTYTSLFICWYTSIIQLLMAQPAPMNTNYLLRSFHNLRLSHFLIIRIKTGNSGRFTHQFQDKRFHRIYSKWWHKLQKNNRKSRKYFQSKICRIHIYIGLFIYLYPHSNEYM